MLVRFSIVAMKYQKSKWREGLFFVVVWGLVGIWGFLGKLVSQFVCLFGAACWLALYGLLNLLSYRPQDHLPRDGTTHSRLCSIHPINH